MAIKLDQSVKLAAIKKGMRSVQVSVYVSGVGNVSTRSPNVKLKLKKQKKA